MKKIFNFAWGMITVVNEADQHSQLMVYDTIGRDPWESGGITADDFVKSLNDIPSDKDLHIHVNSKGGDVHHGMAMKSALLNWKNTTGKKIVCIIDGVAASTASWAFPTASDEVRAFKGSQVFVHDAMAFAYGNAAELVDLADDLNKTSDQIADMYADQSGKSKKHWRDLMKDETLLTGEEAEEEGLVDKIVDGDSKRNFTTREVLNMSKRIASFKNSIAKNGEEPKKTNTMNKKRVIAILNKEGVTEWDGKPINEQTSDEHLEAALESVLNKKKAAVAPAVPAPANAQPAPAPAPALTAEQRIADMQKQINRLTETENIAKTNRVTLEIDNLIVADKLTIAERPAAFARAMKDDTYLNELQARPARPPGASPLRPVVDLVGEAFSDVQNYLLENGPKFMRNFIGARADGPLGEQTCEEIKNRAIIVANTIAKHKKMLTGMFNTNTIDAGLQRQIILQEMLEEFAVVLLPLTSFSTVFSNVPLEGTDEVDVPFYPLATDAGNSWDSAVGYATMGDTGTNTRPVVVGGSGANSGANAPANTARDRKWIGAKFSSYEMDRQPYLNVQKLMIQKANRLAVLLFQDIVSRVITAANFAASVKTVAAPQFSGDDIADLWETATGRNWPTRGRSLVLTHQYKTPLLKDSTFKQYLSYGATDPLRKAVIQEAYGFEDMPIVPNLNTYSPANENLVGWINWLYSVLIATAPIMPTPDVRALMTRYDVIVHPVLGIAFEYRRFGDATLDQTKEIVECSYGANKGVASALARITSQ